MIVKMSKQYERELTDFIYKYNNLKEYFVAWVPENYSEISEYDKSDFLLCIEENKIVGFLGAHISEEQKIVRLLGPTIEETYFEKHADELFAILMDSLPKEMKELRIALFEENSMCRKWCHRKGFELYNAEKGLIFNKEAFTEAAVPSCVELLPFEDKYKEGLSLVHPNEVFFTLNELIGEINEQHHLLLSVVNGNVAGYIYYEISKDNKLGEIVLLHVKEDQRSKGYGSLLLNKAIRHMVDTEVESIETSVRVANVRAQQLYVRVGFSDKETVYAYKKSI